MREISTIVGLEVIGIADGKVIGRVSEVVCDLASGKLVGLITGEGPAEKGIPADAIVTIGDDAVMVPASDAAEPLSQMDDLMRLRREGRPLEVVTDDGRRIGRVSRIWIDPVNKLVTRYEVSRGVVQDITEGRLMLPVIEGTVHGTDTLIVPAAQAMALSGHTGGLRDALRKLSQRVKEQSAAARERAEEAARAARERVQQAVEAAKETIEESKHAQPAEGQQAPAEQAVPEPPPQQTDEQTEEPAGQVTTALPEAQATETEEPAASEQDAENEQQETAPHESKEDKEQEAGTEPWL